MELKFRSTGDWTKGRKVLIAPLWNWNRQRHSKPWQSLCSNRTFMELKLRGNTDIDIVDYCSNRTFMELKFVYYHLSRFCSLVLIAPLWNWNLLAATLVVLDISSNRTFMELKWSKRSLRLLKPSTVLIAPLWNWNSGNRFLPWLSDKF